ncbi:MAG TPA: ABC transporter permease subunit [Bryobacteraceae bacterium]|jgi:sodium transport system permease protein
MRFDILKTIYIKEMLDQLRDRRALLSMIIIPLIAIPALMVGMGFVISKVQKNAEDEAKTLGIGLKISSPEIRQAIEKAGLKIVDKPDLKEAVEKKELAAAVEEIDNPGGVPQIVYYVDQSSPTSETAGDLLRAILSDYRDSSIRRRLRDQNVPEAILTPFSLKRVNVAPERKMAGAMWGTMLGYILLLLMFTGGMYPAIDMTAGEKERKTLELYLSSPAHRSEIVLGKILAAMTAIFITAMLTLASMVFSIRNGGLAGKNKEMQQMLKTIPLDGHAIGLIVLTMLPLALLAASIMIAIAILARSFKEGQTYLTPLALIVIFPALIGGMPGLQFTPTMALIPIFNASQVIRSTLLGDLTATNFLITTFANIVYAAAAFYFASRRFEDETVLFRT